MTRNEVANREESAPCTEVILIAIPAPTVATLAKKLGEGRDIGFKIVKR